MSLASGRREHALDRRSAGGARFAARPGMRSVLALLVTLTISSPATPQTAADGPDRIRLTAALERLIDTGEPRHTSHDEGEWLQAQVERAVARNDTAIVDLARRAAAPIVVRVTAPVSPTTEPFVLTVMTRAVLTVRPAADYRAEIWLSFDGGEWTRLGVVSPDRETSLQVPPEAVNAGVHHARVSARMTFSPESGLEPEVRSLPDVFFARYDPAINVRHDARLLVASAIDISAHRLDARLPDLPFGLWLQTLALSHGGQFDERFWRTAFCEERVAEAGVRPDGRNICALVDFMVAGAVGRIWIRTGRIEASSGGVRWLVEVPEVEGMLMGGIEFRSVSLLPELLATPREAWPSGDVSIAPEEISLTVAKQTVRITAQVRNIGGEPLHDVHVTIAMATGNERGQSLARVVDIAPYGATPIEAELPLNNRYATVMIQAMQLGEHAPHESWIPDPTPENSVAFRIVNPRAAPAGYADWIRSQCGHVCRGY